MSKSFLVESQNKSGQQTGRQLSEKAILPVFSANKLLASSKRQAIIAEIKKLVALDDDYFKALYLHLIESFAEFVQVLPVNIDARLGGLLDEGLLRGLHAVSIQRSESKETQHLMTYVLFSAMLMFDIGNVVENRTIAISTRQGEYVRDWLPFSGAMQDSEGYYRVWRRGGYPLWVCRRITIQLARQIMPEVGFNWIANDPYAFNIWLALLADDKTGAGALSLFFTRAQEWLEEFQTTEDFFEMPFDFEIIESKDTEFGIDFLNWLHKEALANINKTDSKLYAVDNNILLTSAALKKFLQDNNLNVSEKSVIAALEKLGIKCDEAKYQALLKGENVVQTVQVGKSTSLFGGIKVPEAQAVSQAQAQISGAPESVKHFIEGQPILQGTMLNTGFSLVASAAAAAILPLLLTHSNVIVQSAFNPTELPKLAGKADLALVTASA